MILTATSDWSGYTIGEKAKRLQVLQRDQDMQVPDFLVLPAEGLHDIESLDIDTALEQLSTERYAVRSAALGEDTKQTAQAGAFSTKLNLKAEDVKGACWEVLEDAKQKGVSTDSFSLIIQVYLSPVVQGVVFSRDPRGQPGTLIEYSTGEAEENVVDGGTVERIRSVAGKTTPISSFAHADHLFRIAQKLEQQFGRPQDIEWVVHNERVHVVQSRDVTTLTEARLKALHHIDDLLHKEGGFFYEQSSITESVSQPTPLMFSFLKWLYRAGGPVEQAYRDLGLRYTATEQFVLLGNQLFIDKQAETRSLFPAMGHLLRGQKEPGVERFRGLFTTVRNIQRFKTIEPDIAKENPSVMQEFLSSTDRPSNIADALRLFGTWYPYVFRINVLATLAAGKVLPPPAGSFCFEFDPADINGSLVGNSLSLDDRSNFIAAALRVTDGDSPVQAWSKYREFGRWVTVKLVSELRAAIEASQYGEDAWWMTLDECLESGADAEVLSTRRAAQEQWAAYDFPRVVSSFPIEETGGTIGISDGMAEGVLTQPALLSAGNERQILLVDTLSPDLVKYLPQVKGVVSRTGGVLSHFAIMAREHQVPVVVTQQPMNELLGEQVVVDGTNGTIQKLPSE